MEHENLLQNFLCIDNFMSLSLFLLKVDRKDHFRHPGLLHIIICAFLGYKTSNFVKKLDVTDVLRTSEFEGFDLESGPRPF